MRHQKGSFTSVSMLWIANFPCKYIEEFDSLIIQEIQSSNFFFKNVFTRPNIN